MTKQAKCLAFFSEKIDPSFLQIIKREDQETIIFELETIAAALHVISSFVRGRRVVIFVLATKLHKPALWSVSPPTIT